MKKRSSSPRSRFNRRPQSSSKSTGPVKTFIIEGATHEGNGVARDGGKVTFVSGALIGETVEARVIKEGRQFNQAEMTRCLEPSPDRVTPFCPHYDVCGGCQLQHLSTEGQRELKVNWLKNQFRNLPIPTQFEQLVDQPTGYRRRARLSVFVKNGAARIGFRAKSSNDIVDIDNCPVLEEGLQHVFGDLKEQLIASGLLGKIGHIEMLQDEGGVCLVIRQSRSLPDNEKKALNQWAQSVPLTLYWLAPENDRLILDNWRYYNLDGVRIQFHPQDFIQVNPQVNHKMVTQAMDWLAPQEDDVVLDLFCGAGNFSLPLARRAGRVVGVEVLESMVENGRINAINASLDNLEFIAADLTKSPSNQIKKAKITQALLDPPRAGAFEFLPTLVKLKPKQILYVSCNASTLARDAEYLVANGYVVKRVSMMDMFPQTAHVETMMLLQYKSLPEG